MGREMDDESARGLKKSAKQKRTFLLPREDSHKYHFHAEKSNIFRARRALD